jgi:hypothetical protein
LYSRRLYVEKFSSDTMCESTFSLYQKLLALDN